MHKATHGAKRILVWKRAIHDGLEDNRRVSCTTAESSSLRHHVIVREASIIQLCTSVMIIIAEASLSEQHTDLLICHCKKHVSQTSIDIYVSHKPTARTATVSVVTYAWTKLCTLAAFLTLRAINIYAVMALTWSDLNHRCDRICTASEHPAGVIPQLACYLYYASTSQATPASNMQWLQTNNRNLISYLFSWYLHTHAADN